VDGDGDGFIDASEIYLNFLQVSVGASILSNKARKDNSNMWLQRRDVRDTNDDRGDLRQLQKYAS
jgi:hypothetical protein